MRTREYIYYNNEKQILLSIHYQNNFDHLLIVWLSGYFVVLLFAWRRKSPQTQPLRQRLLPLVTSKRQEKQGSHPKEKDTKKRSNHYWLLRFSILT